MFAYNNNLSADTEMSIESISFGTIIAAPSGDSFEINARKSSATPYKTSSGASCIVEKGQSGLIRIRNTEFQDGHTFSVTYEDQNVILSNDDGGGELTYSNIADLSTDSGTIDTEYTDIHIGGRLEIKPQSRSGHYRGSIHIIINYE
jgi:hypothetical protein